MLKSQHGGPWAWQICIGCSSSSPKINCRSAVCCRKAGGKGDLELSYVTPTVRKATFISLKYFPRVPSELGTAWQKNLAQTTRVSIPKGFVLLLRNAHRCAEVFWGQTFGDGISSLPLLLFFYHNVVEWLRRVRVRFRSQLVWGHTLPSHLSLHLLLHEMLPGWYDHLLCRAESKICCIKALTTRQEQEVISLWVLKPFFFHGRKCFSDKASHPHNKLTSWFVAWV